MFFYFILTDILISFHFYTAHLLYCEFGAAPFFRTAQTISVHKEVKATEMAVDENGDFDEYIMCEVKTNTHGVTLLLTCIYRSPNSSEDNNAKLMKLLAVIDKHPAKLKCTVGDFNLPGINWESGETRDY